MKKDTLKAYRYLLEKKLYNRYINEDVTKYNQDQQVDPALYSGEMTKGIDNSNRVPYMLRQQNLPYEIDQRVERYEMPDGIQNMGNGWWKVNGNWYYFQQPFRPVGVNEHGVPIVDTGDPLNRGRRPDLDRQPKDRYDKFPKNPRPGEYTRIRGEDGRIHYYRFYNPPGVWGPMPHRYNPDYEEPGYAYPPQNMPLPPQSGEDFNPDLQIPGGNFGQGVGGGAWPMFDEQWQQYPGLPRPGSPNDLPDWPSPVDNPADPVLPPPTIDDYWIPPYGGYPGWPTPETPYPWYPDSGYPRPTRGPFNYPNFNHPLFRPPRR